MSRFPVFLVLSSATLLAVAACDPGGSTSGPDTTASNRDTTVADAPDGADASTYHPPERWSFPDEFLFGAAVAGFQVDMGCPTLPTDRCRDDNSDWYEFVSTQEMVEDSQNHLAGDAVSKEAGFWELYAEDLQRADRQLHNDAFRFSIEWSRIFPEPTDDLETFEALRQAADSRAVEHYHAMLSEMRDRGLEPMVTLNHYTLPTWLHDAVGCHEDFSACENRGWVDRERTVREIAKYARFVAREFGGQVDRWATLNEPMAVVVPGYLQPREERSNPPAVLLKADAAKTVLRAMIEGHARMYDAIREADTEDADDDGEAASTGIVLNISPVQPVDPDSEEDRQAVENVDYLYNRLFLNALVDGKFDGNLDGDPEDRPELADRLDWVGVNYYATIRVSGVEHSILPQLSPLLTFNPGGFEFDFSRPRGLYESVTAIHERYGLPIVVTENGSTIGGSDDPDKVSRYLVRHLAWLNRAMVEGVPVRGYFYWSLVDTYEWNKGMGVKMGLFGFDPDDPQKSRTARPAAETYGTIAERHSIPKSLRDQFLP